MTAIVSLIAAMVLGLTGYASAGMSAHFLRKREWTPGLWGLIFAVMLAAWAVGAILKVFA